MIDTDKYEGHNLSKQGWTGSDYIYNTKGDIIFDIDDVGGNEATLILLNDAPLLLAEVKRLRGLLDEIDDIVYYNDKKAGQVLPVEKPNLELLRDIMMSYTDEAYQIRGDKGEVIE
tara:strand:- start:537 stop:884 length:348 start_codon:yes stop_codon:yes gene_type:complete